MDSLFKYEPLEMLARLKMIEPEMCEDSYSNESYGLEIEDIVKLSKPTREDLKAILMDEHIGAFTKKKKLYMESGLNLDIEEDTVEAIVDLIVKEDAGARSVKNIMNQFADNQYFYDMKVGGYSGMKIHKGMFYGEAPIFVKGGDDSEKCARLAYIITDFTCDRFFEGKEKYNFYGRLGSESERVVIVKNDWDQVLLGKIKVFIPECIDNALGDEVLSAMVLNQMYEHSTIVVHKNTNRKLFEHIMNQPRDKKSNISAGESLLELKIYYLMEKSAVENAVLEYQESQASSLKWGSLLKDTETSIPDRIMCSDVGGQLLNDDMRKGNLPNVYRWFKRMDNDNPPDLRRIHRRLDRLRSAYEDIELSDYLEVKNEHKRIIVEANKTGKGFPVIYIRDGKGDKTEIKDVGMSELLCMDVRVLDPAIVAPEQVLALLVFYIEYPIRVGHIQKHYFLQSIVGMKLLTLDSV